MQPGGYGQGPPGGQPPGGQPQPGWGQPAGGPPPGGGGYGGPPGPDPNAAGRVGPPAIALIVVAAIGVVFQLLGLVLQVTGTGMAAMYDAYPMGEMMSGGMAIASSVVGILIAGFIIFGGIKMRNLQMWPLSIAAAVVAMIPCISPCCVLGLPVGIWAIVMLVKPEIKAAFAS